MPLLIFIYSMMGQPICKYEPFSQEVSVDRVSDAQVTVKTLWPLVQRCHPVSIYIYYSYDFFICRFIFTEN